MKRFALIAAFAAGVGLLASFNASATVTYRFQGTCTHLEVGPTNQAPHTDIPCSSLSSPIATLILTMIDSYIPGTDIAGYPGDPAANHCCGVLSALYSDAFPFSAIVGTGLGTSGILPVTTGAADISLFSEGDLLTTFADGSWRFICCEFGVFHLMTGINGVWTLVPEPGTLALLGVGLAGLGVSRRRRSQP